MAKTPTSPVVPEPRQFPFLQMPGPVDYSPVISALRSMQETAQRDMVQQAADEAEEEGRVEGAAAAREKRPIRETANTTAGRAFKAGAYTTLQGHMEQDAKEMVTVLETRHRFDPGGYQQSAETAVSTYLETMPDDLRAYMGPRLKSIFESGYRSRLAAAVEKGDRDTRDGLEVGLRSLKEDLEKAVAADDPGSVTSIFGQVQDDGTVSGGALPALLDNAVRAGVLAPADATRKLVEYQQHYEDRQTVKAFREGGMKITDIDAWDSRTDVDDDRKKRVHDEMVGIWAWETRKADTYTEQMDRARDLERQQANREGTFKIFTGEIASPVALQEFWAKNPALKREDFAGLSETMSLVEKQANQVIEDKNVTRAVDIATTSGTTTVDELNKVYRLSVEKGRGLTREAYLRSVERLESEERRMEDRAYSQGKELISRFFGTDFDSMMANAMTRRLGVSEDKEYLQVAAEALDEYVERTSKDPPEPGGPVEIARDIVERYKKRLENPSSIVLRLPHIPNTPDGDMQIIGTMGPPNGSMTAYEVSQELVRRRHLRGGK